MNKKMENRFIITKSGNNDFSTTTTIIIDRLTGVNYLFARNSYGGGLTPLLNPDGTPVVTQVTEPQ